MSNKIESGGMSESSGIELKGDFVRLVWLIEKLRRRDGGCTMNDLIFECKERFCGLEFIKESKMENNPQAPSADRYEMYRNNPYYPFESEKQWLEYDNQLIDKVRAKDKAPSDNCTEDKHIKGCKCEAPSATVDEKMIGIDNVVKLQQTTDAILHSQQEKRYTREEVIDVGVKIVGGERFRPFVIATLDQFDKEGK